MLSLVASFVLSFSSTKTFAQDSRTHAPHPPYAETLHLHGVADVGKLNDFHYRGSQPNDEGLRELKKRGITMIIDLRGERQRLVKSERKKAQALGMRVVNIRASGWSPPPKDKDPLSIRHPIRRFFSASQGQTHTIESGCVASCIA